MRAVPALDRFDPDDAVPTPSHSPANYPHHDFNGSPTPSANAVNPSLVLVLVLAYTSQMKLSLAQHGRGAYGDGEAREAARAMVGVIKVARRAGVVVGLDPMVGVRVYLPIFALLCSFCHARAAAPRFAMPVPLRCSPCPQQLRYTRFFPLPPQCPPPYPLSGSRSVATAKLTRVPRSLPVLGILDLCSVRSRISETRSWPRARARSRGAYQRARAELGPASRSSRRPR